MTSRVHACEREIRRLHKFFMDWFTGALPNIEPVFTDGVSCLSSNFRLISPRGVIDGYTTLLESLRSAHGVFRDAGFAIDIKNCQLIHENEHTVAMTYEEWQSSNTSATTGRVSTVLFHAVKDENDNESLQWLHVHETWLPPNESNVS